MGCETLGSRTSLSQWLANIHFVLWIKNRLCLTHTQCYSYVRLCCYYGQIAYLLKIIIYVITIYCHWVKVKIKCTLVQALRLCTGRTAHRGSRGIALPFYDHGTRRCEGSASRPGRPLSPEKTRTHCTGGWVGPRSGLDRLGKSRPHRDWFPWPSLPYPVAIPTTLPGPLLLSTLPIIEDLACGVSAKFCSQ